MSCNHVTRGVSFVPFLAAVVDGLKLQCWCGCSVVRWLLCFVCDKASVVERTRFYSKLLSSDLKSELSLLLLCC